MRRCPNCDENLERTTYEDLWVEQCVSCQGILVSERRLDAIRRRPDTSPNELRSEIERAASSPSRDATRCPKCTLTMTIEFEYQPFELEYDRCTRCEVIWLDPGEVAMVQLAFESTDRFKSNQKLRSAHVEFQADPERQRRYRENFARLRDSPDSVLGGGSSGLQEGLWNIVNSAKRAGS